VILVLDAHALIWWLEDSSVLASGARAAINDPANDVIVSAATVWELEIKRAAGRLTPPENLLQALDGVGFTILPITGDDAVAAAALVRHHADPFDRMVVAQAERLGATIVTRDDAISASGVDVLPA
jgi:PIN domain nuclease of toxin-antitoxin system